MGKVFLRKPTYLRTATAAVPLAARALWKATGYAREKPGRGLGLQARDIYGFGHGEVADGFPGDEYLEVLLARGTHRASPYSESR